MTIGQGEKISIRSNMRSRSFSDGCGALRGTRTGFRWAALLLLPGLLLLLPKMAAASSAPTLQELTKRVDAHYNHLHSLSVQFTETYRGLGRQRTESGTMLLARHGQMKWTYSQPAGKLFVIDGKFGYSYTPGDAQAQRYPVKQLEDFRSPLRFLLGHARIEKELNGLTMTPDGSSFRLRGVPRGMEQQVSDVTLTVTAQGTIQAIEWTETNGATTEFRLTDERQNPPIAASAFTFEPPDGVVVVRGLAPI